jgi:hypothetical protein
MGENKKPCFLFYWTEEHYGKSLSLAELECRFLEDEDQRLFRIYETLLRMVGFPFIAKKSWELLVATMRHAYVGCRVFHISFILACRSFANIYVLFLQLGSCPAMPTRPQNVMPRAKQGGYLGSFSCQFCRNDCFSCSHHGAYCRCYWWDSYYWEPGTPSAGVEIATT